MRLRHHGFTLIEIAIVLIVVGLLLGSVLKGQELIHNAKAKNLANDFRVVSNFVYSYQDRFRAVPGDDANAVGHVAASANATAPAGGVGNGRINGNWNSANPNDESYLFWEQVRRAGLAPGNPVPGAADYPQTNAEGGRVGITGDPVFTGTPAWPAAFHVCSSNIQGRHARQIDTALDDGNTATGALRVLGTQSGGILVTANSFYAVTPADDTTPYTVCLAY